MRRNDLDLARYLADLAARLNAAATRRFGHALLTVRHFRTPEALPVATIATGQGPGMPVPKGRSLLDERIPRS